MIIRKKKYLELQRKYEHYDRMAHATFKVEVLIKDEPATIWLCSLHDLFVKARFSDELRDPGALDWIHGPVRITVTRN